MDQRRMKINGIELIIKKYKKEFRIPENLNYYSEEDYQKAEKQFIRFCLATGRRSDILSEDEPDLTYF
jgi:hypothetical protein